jgi:hypothetical protein
MVKVANRRGLDQRRLDLDVAWRRGAGTGGGPCRRAVVMASASLGRSGRWDVSTMPARTAVVTRG